MRLGKSFSPNMVDQKTLWLIWGKPSLQNSINLSILLFSLSRTQTFLTATLSSGATIVFLICRLHELKLPPTTTDWPPRFCIFGKGFQLAQGPTDLQRVTESQLTRSGWSHEASIQLDTAVISYSLFLFLLPEQRAVFCLKKHPHNQKHMQKPGVFNHAHCFRINMCEVMPIYYKSRMHSHAANCGG